MSRSTHPKSKHPKSRSFKHSLPPSKTWFGRMSFGILLCFFLATPVLFYGAARAVQSNNNQVGDWLPAAFRETEQLNWYRQHFASDQFVVLSWDGCKIDGSISEDGSVPADPRIDQLANLLISDSPVGGQQGAQPYGHYFKSIYTGPRLLEYLSDSVSGIPFDIAKQRLVGSFLGPDRQQTCLLITLSDAALPNLRQVLARPMVGPLGFQHPAGVLFTALGNCEIDADQARLGGPPVDNVAIDEEGERTLIRLAGLSGLLGLTLSWWSLRSVRLTCIVFSCGILSAAAGLASLWIAGTNTDAIVLSMPALVYVLGISGAVHLINYYRDAIGDVGPKAAPGKAIAMGWKPAVLCSLTTAFGLLSLCASELTPIQKFGFYSAIGVMEMLIVLFLFLPAALYMWPDKLPVASIRTKGKSKSREATVPASDGSMQRFWDALCDVIVRHHALVTITFLVLIVGLVSGLRYYRTSIDLMKLFGKEARILKDYRWIEANLGPLVPVEIVLGFDSESIAKTGESTSSGQDGKAVWTLLERMNIVAATQRTIEQKFGAHGNNVIGPTMSALTFVPPLPRQNRSMGSFVQRKLMNRKLEQAYDSISNSGYMAFDKDSNRELWRISLRVAAFKDVDYGQFTESLKALVDPAITQAAAKYAKADGSIHQVNHVSARSAQPAITTVYTGVVPIVYKAQTALLRSLISSTVWSFLTITPLLMLVSRGFFAGMVAMLPNVLPVLVVFGGISWLGQPVEIGSMMAASIALGVAVDDTIHYLTWFRVSLNRDGDRLNAIRSAYHHCATPTLQATLINGLGLSVFMVSTFSPTKQFGYLMLVILFAGAIAELLLLPALLAGPLGRVFKLSQKNADKIMQHPDSASTSDVTTVAT